MARVTLRGSAGYAALGISWALLACASFGAGSAAAQSAPPTPQPPIRPAPDVNGVDLVTGAFTPTFQELSIGDARVGGFSLSQTFVAGASGLSPIWSMGGNVTSNANGSTLIVNVGAVSDSFAITGGTGYSALGTGDTVAVGTDSQGRTTYTLTRRDGAVFYFRIDSNLPGSPGEMITGTMPNGEIDTYTYTSGVIVIGGTNYTVTRLQSVTNNFGYQLQIRHSTDTLNSDGSNLSAWVVPTIVTAINNAVDYCAPTAFSCSGLTQAWPTVTYGGSGNFTITDALNRVTTVAPGQGTLGPVGVGSVVTPRGVTTTVTYDTHGRVASFSNSVGTWAYAFAGGGTTGTVTVTDPNGHTRTVQSNLIALQVNKDTDALNRTTTYGLDALGRITSVTLPEGNSVSLTYDSNSISTTRGNVLTVTRTAKPGSPLLATATSATYDANCTPPSSSPAKCNEPNTTTDANTRTTSYTYDNTTGHALSVTGPPPTSGAPQPQTRFGYTPTYAYYKNSGGSIVQAASPVSLLTSTSTCQTDAPPPATSCPGTSDEVKTTLAYGVINTANNLLPTSMSAAAGDGSLISTTSTTYDAVGNVAATIAPLGPSQTTVFLYDAARERIGIFGPQTSATSGYPTTRINYNADGLVFETERGVDTSQSDTNWSTFTSLEQTSITFDSVDRPSMTTVTGGATTWNLSQASYDNASRQTCTAVRMNPATFSSPPSSACTGATPGPSGPDRIVLDTYDSADELTQVTSAVGTTNPTTYLTKTYSNNGQPTTILDANNNLTTYTYDGFDRLSQINYPAVTKGSGTSDSSDYEAYSYDANDNQTSTRRRSGSADTVQFRYDALNRLIEKDVPTWSGQNVFNSYDLLNRLTASRFGSTSGPGVILTYDALSRKTGENNQGLALNYQYDAAGDRTQLTWSDGYYANYTYDALQRPTITTDRVSGANRTLANYYYDNLGRLNSVTRGGNPANTTYGYDGADRLTSLTQTFTNSAMSVTWTFAYNPANQIVTRASTNDSYTSHPSPRTLTFVANGLNQYTSVNGTSYSYDGRGNLASDGLRAFTYDIDNNLLTGSAPSATTLTYDPLGRMFNGTTGGQTLTTIFDSGDLTADYAGTAINFRLVPSGLGPRSPLVWQNGVGVTAPRWLQDDNQGSIVAWSDSSGSGNPATPFGYDPYGSPDATNGAGGAPVRYTGQVPLASLNLDYYLARDYDWTLGRFLQPDPIGQAGGVNLYAYVGNDPVNSSDPLGLDCVGDPGGCPSVGATTVAVPAVGTDIGGLIVTAAAPAAAPTMIEFIGNVAAGAAFLSLIPTDAIATESDVGKGLYAGPQWLETRQHKPPKDARDPNGAKAPGKPGEKQGFKDPKGGEQWVPNPNGSGSGWLADDGKVWVPTGQGGTAHGGGGGLSGAHWDVQNPRNGGNESVYPSGFRR